MTELSTYKLESLREDAEFVVYRGRREAAPCSILVVAPSSKQPAQETLRRIEHEYELRTELDPAWATQPLALVRYEGQPVLVLEDPGGEPLDRLLAQPLELTQVLRIAIGLSAALEGLHERDIIHKDIKPANALVDQTSGLIWLTGFGMASEIPRERQAAEPPEAIAGTLAYMAPEQTGRMNRSIDSRSDLYSLGVTLYEMLTGTLPFAVSDPIEWVHCHIAREPTPAAERRKEVPNVLSAIVSKLLAKIPEERYQTAAGLKADLRRCLGDWESLGQIAPFFLGEHDASDRLLIPEKLYGRDREIKALLEAFDRVVAHGRPELVLVSGYSGIGKSSVVNELHKALVLPRGIFISGKFDQYKRDIPYATLAQAFETLVRQILSKGELEVGRWCHAIRDAVGLNGRLVVDLIPELELMIGKQAPVPEFHPQEAQNRFQAVFRAFLGVFARKEHPLALFLDDLQWLDAATLKLLEHLVTHSDVRYLLLIGAYRDNEVGPSHPLMLMLNSIRKTETIVRDIVLGPLSNGDVDQLVADSLHQKRTRTEPLARLVYEKSAGNPYFAIQFLTALVEERLLQFDLREADWRWDVDRIRTRRITDNVVDFLVGKLNRIPTATRETLKELASLGNSAETVALTVVHGGSEEEVHTDLRAAVREGLVVRLGGSYRFVHDRVQEAAYSLIPDGMRAEVHLQIGRLLMTQMPAGERDDNLFDVVNQLNRGAALLSDLNEKRRVAELNLRAGKKAKASTAYATACIHLSAGMALLDREDWESRYQLAFDLWLLRAECEFLCGNFDEAARLISELIKRAASKTDKAAAYRLKIDFHIMKSVYHEAVDSALEGLSLFDIDVPGHPTWERVNDEYEQVWRNLGALSIESLIDLPPMADPEIQAATSLLSRLYEVAFFTDKNLFLLSTCHIVNLSLRYGTIDASAHGYASFGNILGRAFHRYADAYRFGKLGVDLAERHGFAAYKARVYMNMAWVAIWTKPVTTALDFVRAAFSAAVETGDVIFACYCCDHTVTDLLARGDHLDEVWRESEKCVDFVRKAKSRDYLDRVASQQQFIQTMREPTAIFSILGDTHLDQAAFEVQVTGDRTSVCWYWILKLQTRFLLGDYESAIAAAQKAKPLLWAATGCIQLLDYHYYTALALAAVIKTAPPDRQEEWSETLCAHVEQLRDWAENCAPIFQDKHALVSAEVARIDGRDVDAMRLYEQAIRFARENGFVHNEGIANEVAARFYLNRGFETIGHIHLRNARYCYLRWGARGKVKQLERLYPVLGEQAPPGPTATIDASIEQLDLRTVVKALQAVSREIDLGKLIEALMVIAVQHAGAERGLLFLSRGKEHGIEAEATTGQDGVRVILRQAFVTLPKFPESVLRYVIRTRVSVLLNDASTENLFSDDEYVRGKRLRSILCLPLVKGGDLIGVLYLENNLTSRAFTPEQFAVLELLASQAAISLKNARLYAELQHENSDRRKAEEALRASEERWRNLFENSSAGIALLTPDGRFIAANLALQKILGYSDEELQQLTPLELTYEEDRASTEARLAEFAKGRRREHRIEKRCLHKDGRLIWIDLSAVFIPAAGSTPASFSAVIVDITERKQAQERFRLVVEASPNGIVLFNAQRHIVLVNASIEKMFGYGRDELIGQGIELLVPERFRGEHPAHRAGFHATPVARTMGAGRELFARRKDGTEFPVEIGISPIQSPEGTLVLSVIVDISARKRAEAEARQHREELAHLSRVGLVGEMAGSLAHELNQPLTGIVNNASAGRRFIAKGRVDLPKLDALFEAVVADGRRAGEVIRGIRGMVRKGEEVRVPVNLNDAIGSVLRFAGSDALGHRCALVTEIDPKLPVVEADLVQLQQVLLNLVVNALEAMRDTPAAERRMIIRSEWESEGRVRVSVRDFGPGLPAEEPQRIFEQFFSTKREGMGMGLAIARSIITSHGGELAAANAQGGGACVHFSLPVMAEDQGG
jgi:PAS domain S-box-containing protein